MTPNPGQPAWWTKDHWTTPREIVDEYARRCHIERFDLDPCARDATVCTGRYFYSPTQDGLQQAWFGTVFCNPPYSDPAAWVEKAVQELQAGRISVAVLLLPPAVDTNWYHDAVVPYADVEFRRGRIQFLDWRRLPVPNPRQGNLVAVYPKGVLHA